MAAQRRVTVSAKLTVNEDADLIAWWKRLPKGSRSAVIKDMMRDYLDRNGGGYRPIFPRNVPQPFDPSRFTQMCEDTAWIRGALSNLPGYLETMLGQMSAAGYASHSRDQPQTGGSNRRGETTTSRREARVRQAQW
jgi:hypothetical protein